MCSRIKKEKRNWEWDHSVLASSRMTVALAEHVN